MELITCEVAKMRTKRKTLIEERYYGIKRRQLSFMKMVQERASKMKTSLAPFLPNDLIFKIFLLLPIKTLLRFSCVCKSWKKLIHCAEFVEAYNNEAQSTVLLLRTIKADRLNTFHVETQVRQLESFSIFPWSAMEMQRSKVISFLEIEEGKSKIVDLNISCLGSIVAACNGLILISSMFEKTNETDRIRRRERPTFDSHERPGRLIIINPMTRKFLGFPLGTLPSSLREGESYGLVFGYSQAVYKVVHLFKDELGHIACEIWSMETRYWKAIDGPSEDLIRRFSHWPIWASGALHWLPSRNHHSNHPIDYIVSMGAENERFSVTNLPKWIGRNDQLVEMGGFLTYVSSLDTNHIEVWVLKGLEGSEWIKQHTVHIDAIVGYVENNEYFMPVLAVNAKEMIFRRTKKLYSYDFEAEEAREIEMEGGSIHEHEFLMPHTNNLATWEPLEPML